MALEPVRAGPTQPVSFGVTPLNSSGPFQCCHLPLMQFPVPRGWEAGLGDRKVLPSRLLSREAARTRVPGPHAGPHASRAGVCTGGRSSVHMFNTQAYVYFAVFLKILYTYMSDSKPFFALKMRLFGRNNRTYMKHLDQFRLEFLFDHDTQFLKSAGTCLMVESESDLEAGFLWASAARRHSDPCRAGQGRAALAQGAGTRTAPGAARRLGRGGEAPASLAVWHSASASTPLVPSFSRHRRRLLRT